MSALSRLLAVELPDELPDREDWFGSLSRNQQADPEAFRRPSPPARELSFPSGSAYLPEEFLYQYHEAPREQEPQSGRLPMPEDRPRVPGPVENGVELAVPPGSEGGRQYLELPGARIPVGQIAENPGHHLRHIFDPFIATWGLGTAGAEAASGLHTLGRVLRRLDLGRGDSKIETLREAPAR